MSTALQIEVLFFDGVEELDAVGPWEVLRFWQRLGERPVEVRSVSPDGRPARCSHGLMVSVDGILAERGRPDVLIHPGGPGATERASDSRYVGLIRDLVTAGTFPASVCTGAQVLAAAGVLDGKAATTHWRARDALRESFPAVDVRDDVRWVDAGDVVTSAGVSAGIDMALHLVHRFESEDVAEQVARAMEYPWRAAPGAPVA